MRCAVTNSEAVNSLNDRIAASSQPLTRPGSEQRQGDGGQHPGRRRAEACGSELEPLIEIAQRDVDAAQHERQDQHDVAGDDDGKAARPANLRGKDQKAQPDGEMRA